MPTGSAASSGGTSAWQHFKRLPKRQKVLIIIAVPLWLPVAFVEWLIDGGPPSEKGW